jgi:hypothetical protein
MIKITLLIVLAINLIAVPQLLAIDCTVANEKLSVFTLMRHSSLIGDRKLTEALNATYDSLNYLDCIKDYSDDTIKSLRWLAMNLGSVYKYQKISEDEAFNLYNKKLGKYIKNSSIELYLFEDFLSSYADALVAKYGGQIKKDGNICTFTTEWGTVYFGCNEVNRVSNSPLASVLQLNELLLTKVLVNLAYVGNIYSSPSCDKNTPTIDSLYGIFPMATTENRLMKMSTNAPVMSKKLAEKALKLDFSFYEVANTCKTDQQRKK